MIAEVKFFIEDFFRKEVEARNAYVKPDRNFAYAKLDEMNSFCIPEVYDSFGMVKSIFPHPPGFYQQHGNTTYFERNVFKVSQYESEKYGDLFLVYVSDFSTNYTKSPLSISLCLFVAKVNGELKIVRQFFFGGDDLVPEWNPSAGDREVSFETLGWFVKVERYLESKDDEFSLLEYNRDK